MLPVLSESFPGLKRILKTVGSQFDGRKPECFLSQFVFAGERGAEKRRIVGVDGNGHPSIVKRSHRMFFQRCHRTGANVAGDADLERYVVLTKLCHQSWILGRGDAMPDSLRSNRERTPD